PVSAERRTLRRPGGQGSDLGREIGGAGLKLLVGKKVLITGGSRGLGRELCLRFAEHGASVGFSYNRNVDAARNLEEELEAMGAPFRSYQCSVLDTDGTQQ